MRARLRGAVPDAFGPVSTRWAERSTYEFAESVVRGLSATPPRLECRFLYDERGSQLFEQITELSEYYPTRYETRILGRRASEIAAITGPVPIVELGSGSSKKTQLLTSAYLSRHGAAHYVPVDVSLQALRDADRTLAQRQPETIVVPVHGTYDTALTLVEALGPSLEVLNLFGPAVTQGEVVDALNHAFGLRLEYAPVSVDDYRADRVEAHGEYLGGVISGIYEGIREGVFDAPCDFARICGRPHAPLDQMVRAERSRAGLRVPTEEMADLVAAAETTVVDVRPSEAYNGWPLGAATRGGHLPGARSLPLRWFDYIDWMDIVEAKGLAPDAPLVVYGHGEEDAEQAARHFRRAGFADVRAYVDFAAEWALASPTAERPLAALSGWRQLVPPRWLHAALATGHEGIDHKRAVVCGAPHHSRPVVCHAPHHSRPVVCHAPHRSRLVVCHAHYRNPGDYAEGHIPGALPVDTNWLESPETWNRRSPEELKAALERLGISHDTTVVLYGRFSAPDNADEFPGSSAGHLGAFRCAHIMHYAGVEDVRILDGGLHAWLDAGYAVTTEEPPPLARVEFGVPIPVRPELFVDLEEARNILAAAGRPLVSVRSWAEYTGAVSGYNYIEKSGRIPGSVFGNCGSDAYHMENYRNLDHTCREAGEIEALLAAVGVRREHDNAFYCGTGWRGAEACVNAWLMGWPNVSVYDGGWFEWSRDERNPYETGDPGAADGS